MRRTEEMPQSQRPTLPTPQPFLDVASVIRRSPGAYRIVNDELREEAPTSTQRSPSYRAALAP